MKPLIILGAALAGCCCAFAQWQNLNPGAGGQIQDIVLDPNTPGRLFYMSDVEGSYRSDDYGSSWTYITADTLNSDHLTAAIEPGNRDRVYLGRENGISISDDEGDSWINVTGIDDPIMAIVVNPDAVNEVYAAVSHRWRWEQFPAGRTGTRLLYRSRDRGATWTAITYETEPGLRDTYSISLSPDDGTDLYLAGQAGVYRSTDRGDSWTRLAPPSAANGVSWGACLSPDGATLYATYVTAGSNAAVFARPTQSVASDASAWVNVFTLGGSAAPASGTYWIPRIDPRSDSSTHRLLTAAFNNAPNGLVELTITIADGIPTTRSWERILSWNRDIYGGDHSSPQSADVGWELYWTRPLTWRYSPTDWGLDQRTIWSTKDQTLFAADTLEPTFPNNWEQRYCTLVSDDHGARTYRTTGTACMVIFDGNGSANHGMMSSADNGLLESWDDGFSWSIDKRPNGGLGSRSNASAYTTVNGVTWALAHVASGFGADSDSGTLFAKQLSQPAKKSDTWRAIAGGPTQTAGLPYQKFNPITVDPSITRRVFVASTWSFTKGNGHIYATDNIVEVINGTGSFRKISGANGPTVGSDQDMGLMVDPNDSNIIYVGADGALVWKGTRTANGSYNWEVIREQASNPFVWNFNGVTLVACITEASDIALSTDGGVTWNIVGTFDDVKPLRSPVWHGGEALRPRGLVAVDDSLFCSFVTHHEQKRSFGVFRGRLDPDTLAATWTDYTSDLPFGYPMKARIVNNYGRPWLYIATWGHGLWRREIRDQIEPGPDGRLVNLSVRAQAGTGNKVLIAGVSIQGDTEKPLLIRTVGPGLEPYDVSGVLPDPTLTIFESATIVGFNDDWSADLITAEKLEVDFSSVGAFPLDRASPDAALQSDLQTGTYTVHAQDATNQSGIALIEVYDLDPRSEDGRLVNLSSRVEASTGADSLVAGFVIGGSDAQTVLIRGIGPTLSTYGVTGVMADPQLQLFSQPVGEPTQQIGANFNWSQSFGHKEISATAARVGAFPLEVGSRDAALIITLNPGSYTVHVSSEDGSPGIALVEVYQAPLSSDRTD